MYMYETRKLTFQLVPQTAWYNNIRNILPNWSLISKKVREAYKCSICNASTSLLDAHEVWKYDNTYITYTIKEIIPVCKLCHSVIHIGHTLLEGNINEALNHYKKVNKLNNEEVERDLVEAFDVFNARSKYLWHLDKEASINIVEKQLNINCHFDNPIDDKFYANVPYMYKEQAKAFGAKWDAINKMWYFLSDANRINWSNFYNKIQHK